jgi:peptidoglycan/LPS O-acetylase OafA/YrhL
VIGGQIAVDTFFFLGGFLVAYLGVRDLEKRGGKIPYGAMVLHRYLRITPAFAFTMVFYSQIVSRIGDGPFFVRFQHSVFRRCDNASWVTSLVYLHNFVPFDSDQVCMGWSWYLGCDMIFFILSPALLLLHHHRPKVMWTVMIAAAVASSALTVRSLPPVLTYPRVRPTR